MPPIRIDASAYTYKPLKVSQKNALQVGVPQIGQNNKKDVNLPENYGKDKIFYPGTPSERTAYRNSRNKAVTSYQWAVYDFIRTIPVGRVMTYKGVSAVVGGSPRSVGNALRNNPFAPYIPCHRVIASNHFVGGFYGEWGPNDKTGTQCHQKISHLASDGVTFTKSGILENSEHALWKRG